MKKILFILLMAFSFMICQAQENHLKFKGIPITGTLDSFVNKLSDKGFSFIGTENGIALLKGEFAGHKNCTVGVSTFEGSVMVCMVSAFFPEQETWASLFNDYQTYKNLLTEKYGKPSCVEKFNKDTHDSDYLKFSAITHDEATFLSTFTSEHGHINLSMNKLTYNKACIVIKYYDNANSKQVRKKIMDDL